MRDWRCALLLALAAAHAGLAAAPDPTSHPTRPADQSLTATDRVLIVAPHPDDETLCCAGFIQQALARGASISIVWVTSGDAFELDAALVEHTLMPRHTAMRRLAEARMVEARTATQSLGIPAEQAWFLGYPDRGIRRLLTDHYAQPFTSHYTGAAAVPYSDALAPGSPYEGQLLERDLLALLDRVQPTRVLVPSPLDLHVDHSAVGELLTRLMYTRHELDRVSYWIVHGGSSWPAPRRYVPQAALTPPARAANLNWSSWPLTATERAGKLSALQRYRSQWEIMRPFLASFVRTNELFAAAAYPSIDGAPGPQPALTP